MRKEPANKTCFECGERGITYIVLNYGVFVCSTCSGIHRNLSNKVKGLGMSLFNDKDLETMEKWGNKKAKKHWMSDYDKTIHPIPKRTDDVKMKEFLKMKYE